MLDRRLRMVGHRDHRVLLEEPVDPAAGVEDARELQVGLRDRVQLAVGTVLVRVPVVVGKREQQEVEQIVLDQIEETQPVWRSRTPGMPSPERQPVGREEKMSA